MNKKITAIAELGWNHGGDIKLATDMVFAAKESGADYVKFQTWKVSRLKPGPWDTDGRREIYEKAELSEDDHFFLVEKCKEADIKFLTACFCKKDLSFVRKLSNEVKIPSPEVGDSDLMFAALSTFDTIYLSLGASTINEYDSWITCPGVIPMHCVSSYPLESKDFHITKFKLIKMLCEEAGKPFGYSGHSPSIWDAVLAISLGATVIEKHFTIDHDLPGRDNKFALLPSEFTQLVQYGRMYSSMIDSYGSLTGILPCETDYCKFHKGRWNG